MVVVAVVMAVCVLALAACAYAARKAGLATPGSIAASAVWCALLGAWCAYCATGLVRCSAGWLAWLVGLALTFAAACALVGPGVRARMGGRSCAFARAGLLVTGVAVALFCLEWPYNDRLFAMDAPFALLNCALLGAALLALWCICQRRRAAAVLFCGVCLGWGVANYFLCLFKEQPVLPADLAALGVAAQVSGGYDFVLLDAPACALCVFVVFAALACFVPAPRLTRAKAALNLVLGFGIAAALLAWYGTVDLEGSHGVKVDVWSSRESYMTYGSLPGFLQRLQDMEPPVPAGYTSQGAAELKARLAEAWDAANSGYPADVAQAMRLQLEATGSAELPSVVVVMNESFSDLSIYPGVEGYDGTSSFDAVDASVRGLAYTSVRGGGTCNSEFEFLTGASLGPLGGGVYPYMFYDLSQADALPRHFKALGYDTTAIHPEAAANWRRDVVYGQLGFDRFLAEEAFEGAPALRGMTTDRATYDAVLEVLRTGDGPQFVFDVTLQNHGGYETGLLDVYPYDGVRVRGTQIPGMSEYLSCVDASQADLEYFLAQLEKLDRKVVVVFFGDHQPGFNDQVAEAAWGVPVEELDLEQVQQRFVAPYLVWYNHDAPAADFAPSGELDTSLGYLGALTVLAAGVPLDDGQKALLELREDLPALNLNGYCDADGAWYWIGQESPASGAYLDFAWLQYANILDVATQ